jgi:hypothetical protein
VINISGVVLTIVAGGASIGIYIATRWGLDRVRTALLAKANYLSKSQINNIIFALDIILTFAPLGLGSLFGKIKKAKNFFRLMQGFILLLSNRSKITGTMKSVFG